MESMMQSHQYQQDTNDDSNHDYLANERCVMFLDLRLHKQGVVSLGHCCFTLGDLRRSADLRVDWLLRERIRTDTAARHKAEKAERPRPASNAGLMCSDLAGPVHALPSRPSEETETP
jgi:hypothetical protein